MYCQLWLRKVLHNFMLCTSCSLSWIGSPIAHFFKSWSSHVWTYCNALFMWLPLKCIWKLQLVQSAMEQQLYHCYTSYSACQFASRYNWRCWLLLWKPCMAWVQVMWRTISAHWDWRTPSHQQRRHSVGSISQGILDGWVQEKGLLCYGSCSLEHFTPWDEISFHPSNFHKGLKT